MNINTIIGRAEESHVERDLQSPEIKTVHGKAMAEKRGFVANIKFIKPTKDIKLSGIYILKAFIEIWAKEVFSELK